MRVAPPYPASHRCSTLRYILGGRPRGWPLPRSLGEPLLQAKAHNRRHRKGVQAFVPTIAPEGLAADREASRHHVPVAPTALDECLAYASRSRLAPFAKLAGTLPAYRVPTGDTVERGSPGPRQSPTPPPSAVSTLPPTGSASVRASSRWLCSSAPGWLVSYPGRGSHNPRVRQKTLRGDRYSGLRSIVSVPFRFPWTCARV